MKLLVIGSVTKKNTLMTFYTICCIGVVFFIFASLGSYEDHYSHMSGVWYSKVSMDQYQYSAYLLTYVVSFPIGTILSLYDSNYLSEKWFVVCVPNFIIYFYLADKIILMLKKGSSGRS